MKRYIIKESQINRLIETGSNSAAMDLDIYVQPVQHDSSNGNENIIDSIKQATTRLEEVMNQLKAGKKLSSEEKNLYFKILDLLNSNYYNSTEL
jgi:DNA-directed RNA polymerase specialized sigma54-like protein